MQGVPIAFAAEKADKTGSLIEVMRAVLQTDRKTIVAANMELTAQESADFWPVYNDYQVDRAKVVDRLVALIGAYAQSYNYKSLTDEKAKEMLDELLSVEKAKVKLRKKYACKFNKVLPEKKVLRFYQLENKMDAVIQLDLASGIPLAK